MVLEHKQRVTGAEKGCQGPGPTADRPGAPQGETRAICSAASLRLQSGFGAPPWNTGNQAGWVPAPPPSLAFRPHTEHGKCYKCRRQPRAEPLITLASSPLAIPFPLHT